MAEKSSLVNTYPSQKRLKKCFLYGRISGELYWIEKKQGRRTGVPAGTVRKAVTYGHHRESSYRYIGVDGKLCAAHRLVWIWNFGDIPDGMQVDHIDGDGLNNRINNLRLVTPSEQAKNRARPMSNTSGHVGVTRSHDSRYWNVIVGGERIGTFGSKREAAERAEGARLLRGYHKNHGRD